MRMNRAVAAIVSSLFIGTALSAQAADHEVASSQLDTEVKFLTDQRTRGVSDSMMQPAIKFSANFAHESGLVAVADLVTVSKQQFPKGNGFDITLGGGYRFGDPDAWHFGAGLAAEIFPGAKVNAPHQNDPLNGVILADNRDTSFSSEFAVLEIGYGALEGRVLNVISKNYRGADTGTVCGALLQFAPDPFAATGDPTSKGNKCYARGDHNSRGSLLFDLDYKIPLNPSTTLTLHVGQQQVANFSEADFTDYRISLTHKKWGFNWNADLVETNVKNKELYLVQDGAQVRQTQKGTLVLSVSRKF